MPTITEFAERVLMATDLSEKLAPPSGPLTDDDRREVTIPEFPGRPENLQVLVRGDAPPMPKLGAMRDPAKRAIAHHIMANHELQALEIMAATLLRYPGAPDEFRRGMVDILQDEQRHTRMHAARCEKLEKPFGAFPVNGYIWRKACEFNDLLDYLAGLPLVFEGANLDHSLEFADAFEAAGDARSAHVMRQIHDDEIEHVAFGIRWLRQFKPPGVSDWETFLNHLHFPLRAEKARGDVFQEQARRDAGLDEEFIANMKSLQPFSKIDKRAPVSPTPVDSQHVECSHG